MVLHLPKAKTVCRRNIRVQERPISSHVGHAYEGPLQWSVKASQWYRCTCRGTGKQATRTSGSAGGWLAALFTRMSDTHTSGQVVESAVCYACGQASQMFTSVLECTACCHDATCRCMWHHAKEVSTPVAGQLQASWPGRDMHIDIRRFPMHTCQAGAFPAADLQFEAAASSTAVPSLHALVPEKLQALCACDDPKLHRDT